MSTQQADVLLISLPWATLEQPSLAFGLVKGILARDGIAVDVRYLNLDFAEELGIGLYRSLKDRDVMVSEWVFSEAMFGRFRPPEQFVGFLRGLGYGEDELTQWARVQAAADDFIERCADAIDWSRYRVVGFTTTMIQTLASLALARRAKQRNPELKIVFGGANCEEEMGAAMVENFDFIDVVVRRDCDAFVSDLFARLRENRSLVGLPICYRENGEVHIEPMPPVFKNLDLNPIPDYDDYFEQLALCDFASDIKVNIVFEGSRGCWYGAKVPCTFCAVNGSSMEYRAKSPERLVNELEHLWKRHDVKWFGAADNILDHSGHMKLCAMLAERIPDAKIFFDVKANLTRPQLTAMKYAGIDEVQPGIESFSTVVLQLMQKGTTGIRNVHLLRMCAEVGIWPMWNYLFGFPNETREHYDDLLAFAQPALFHLPAPYVGFGLSMMRFSEYFKRPKELGIQITGPLPHYSFIYDLPQSQIDRLAYYFDYRHLNGYDPSIVGELVTTMTNAWNQAYYLRKVELTALIEGDDVVIRDTRFDDERHHRLVGGVGRLYRQLERPRRDTQIGKAMRSRHPAEYISLGGQAGIDAVLEQLCAARLVFREDNRWVAVAVPPDPEQFWGLERKIGLSRDNTMRPRPSLLHWKVDHLYETSDLPKIRMGGPS
jgi:ribosomal peptide maturation radical SAM protein 1